MSGNNMFSERDTMDINELASLNNDISPELLEQLSQKISQNVKEFNANDDTTLFEEVEENPIQESTIQENTTEQSTVENNENEFEDKFLKKFQQKNNSVQEESNDEKTTENKDEPSISNIAFGNVEEPEIEQQQQPEETIEQVTNGNITEKEITPEQKNYNDSLDFLDGNVKYSKYVIYIDPQNVDFIESLTVKERKNLINKILREQDDIGITKQRFKIIQTIIRHAIVAILTLAISIPVIYYTINASLEASIDNYRRSQNNFQVLYKDKGKITRN